MKVARVAAALLVAAVLSVSAEERVDLDTYGRIRQEATTNSQIIRTTEVLTDRYGPRLTGSPNLKAAGDWAVTQLQAWGLKNGRMEPWEWKHAGWVNERLSAHITAPVKDHLVAEALAWTPGTNGPVKAQAVHITLPTRPTKEELTAHLESLRNTVRGRIVLVGAHRQVPVTFNEAPERFDDSDVLRMMNAPPARSGAPGQPSAQNSQPPARRPLTSAQITAQLYEFLAANGVPVRVNDAGRDHGQIRAFANASYDPGRAIPTVVLRNEDYGRISRLLADKQIVELEFDIVNRSHPEGRTNYNAVAEIPGSTDEVVMLGAHLDSWHAATGATDNAIGCAVVMEAVRILAKIGVQPRRTIRVALWSGEEQGLHGSRAYVRQHFGTFEEPKPAFAKLAGYVNLDQGTGRARFLRVFGPAAAESVLREALYPFKDLGFLGAATVARRQGFDSDHGSFSEAGLPGIQVVQDPIEYEEITWHSNLDTYERIVEEDVIKSAIVVAATVYHLATRDEMLPRFSKGEMPRRPAQAR
jgi:hypothetical protein